MSETAVAETPTFLAITWANAKGREVEVSAGISVNVADAVMVWAGEYPEDCPDLLIEIHHAVNENGDDLRAEVARRIVALFERPDDPS